MLGLLGATGEVAAKAEERFVVEPAVVEGFARWISVDGDLVAFGADDRVTLARGSAAGPSGIVSHLVLDRAVDEALLAADRLWIAGPDGLSAVALGRPAAEAEPVSLDPPVRGRLRLARSDDHLFVAEDGLGLRIVRLPGHRAGAGHHAHHATPVQQDALLELPESFSAVAAWGGAAWLALPGGTLIVVDVADRTAPRIERRLELGFAAVDLAADGSTLYALAVGGELRVLEPEDGGAYLAATALDTPGATALEVTGRTIRFAAGGDGVVTARDTSSTKALINVSVGDSFFSPRNVTVNVGDTVAWAKAATIFAHNVESCDGTSDPGTCAGEVSDDGLFRSGNATTAAFNYSHVFANPGGNPYFCVIHALGGMTGRVDVMGGGGAGPPPVPDGDSTAGAQVLASRVDATGATLSVSWDTTSCPDAVDHHIVYGYGSQLPGVLGGIYGTTGGACAIGTTSPFTWSSVPDPAVDASRLLWFVVLASDGEGTEGSWGVDSAGGERQGPGTGGASAQCSITAKDTTNACGLGLAEGLNLSPRP